MTEYWISNARHYCKECKCWMDAKASSIRKHEEGYRHKGNVAKLLKQIKRDKIFAQREANKTSMEIAAIERAAKKQYIKDCSSGLATSDGQCTFNTNTNTNRNNRYHQRKDKPSFLPSDNDTFYYLDKNGNCHGPYPSSTMCKWYHFGFFVGGLRLRKREETKFIHLRDIKNPFNYTEFEKNFNTNIEFRKRISQSIDISNARTIPPGIDIPQKLKNEFYKLYPQTQHKQSNNTHKHMYKPEPKHQLFSAGNSKTSHNHNNNKEQRRTFIRNHLRKYKSLCKCGDSDCHLKHNNNNNNNDNDDEEQKECKVVTKEEIKKIELKPKKREDMDELGFGKWETMTKAEFDAKHSNKHMLNEQNKRKRWWRETENANLPSAKRKKLMGLDHLDSDDERDFDDEYGINEIINMRERERENVNNGFNIGYNESSDKIAISIQMKVNVDVDVNEDEMDEENVVIKDAKMKLKKMHENEEQKKQEKKEQMLQKLKESIVNDRVKERTYKVDGELRMRQQLEGKQCGVFKKKKKKKNRQSGKIETVMR